MSSAVEIRPAETGQAYKDFIDLPYRVLGDNPNWAPLLRVQQKDLLDREKHPFFNHAEMATFVAYRNGEAIGRIAAINDSAHNEVHEETTTHFGFFDCFDDPEASNALFEAVAEKARGWGHNMIRGPFNPSINESIGIQIDAFDSPNYILMPSNWPYYPDLVEASGYKKCMDLLCYYISVETLSEKTKRGGELVLKRSKLKFRHSSKQTFWEDFEKLWKVYNIAWEKNWGAVPYTYEEFKHLANDLKQVVDHDMFVIAENAEGDVVAFSVALPNINEALIKNRDGRLFPFGLLRLLWDTRPGQIKGLRFITSGILEEYRGRGIDAVLYYDHYKTAIEKGYTHGEMSWILETNTMMNRGAEMMAGERYKTYRMYEREV